MSMQGTRIVRQLHAPYASSITRALCLQDHAASRVQAVRDLDYNEFNLRTNSVQNPEKTLSPCVL